MRSAEDVASAKASAESSKLRYAPLRRSQGRAGPRLRGPPFSVWAISLWQLAAKKEAAPAELSLSAESGPHWDVQSSRRDRAGI